MQNKICVVLILLIIVATVGTVVLVKNDENSKIEKVKVSFNTDGGTSVETVEIDKYSSVEEPTKPVKEGYNFVSWELNGEEYKFGKLVSKDMELKAKYKEKNVALKGIRVMDAMKVSLKDNEEKIIEVTFIPEDATNKKLTYKVSNPKVATVDETGKLTPLKVGVTYITVTSDEGNFKATLELNVVN